MGKHTLNELKQWQALPLDVKVLMTKDRIRNWVRQYGEDGVYVSFSGGKDSTVLLHIVREDYPYVTAVFCDTGLEYPEIRNFVKTVSNVDWIKPKMNFRKVIETYGYPIISKEVSESVFGAKKYLREISREYGDTDRQTDRKAPYGYYYRKLAGIGEYAKRPNAKKERQIKANIPDKDRSQFSQTKWKFLLDAPFEISNKCCSVMKKMPLHYYYRQTGRKPITAQMASESKLRTQKWIQNGCNGFDLKIPTSNPMAFWTEQDVLQYAKKHNIEIASIYGNIIYEDEDGMQYNDGIFADAFKLRTTGCKRTGCVFCGFGCHLEKEGDGRFERLKVTHPKLYEYVFREWDKGGLGYKEVIDWLNENGNLNIKY